MRHEVLTVSGWYQLLQTVASHQKGFDVPELRRLEAVRNNIMDHLGDYGTQLLELITKERKLRRELGRYPEQLQAALELLGEERMTLEDSYAKTTVPLEFEEHEFSWIKELFMSPQTKFLGSPEAAKRVIAIADMLEKSKAYQVDSDELKALREAKEQRRKE